MRLLPLIGLIPVGCGILNPGDGIRFEWKAVVWGQQEEFVLIEPGRDSAVIKGGMVLYSACSDIDLDHEHLANALTLRVISSTKRSHGDVGCPGVVVTALYTIILSDPVWGDSVIVFHDKRLALQAVL
ncbi:MAG: hypothetical protein IIB90_09895 [Gemmatimonadetes bacterium]|nr:hypothetical protein [Gemmatimonadota bacterium]